MTESQTELEILNLRSTLGDLQNTVTFLAVALAKVTEIQNIRGNTLDGILDHLERLAKHTHYVREAGAFTEGPE